jgi:hypothetical protein
MPKLRRALALPVSLVVAVAFGAVPANAGPGPLPVDTKDSYIPPRAFEMSSSSAGTVFVTDSGVFGHVWLARAPLTTGSTLVDLGPRPSANTDAAAPSIRGTQVAVPQSAFLSNVVTTVKYCAAASCPTTSTFTVPSGWTYLGNGEDRALLYNATTHALGLSLWTGGAVTSVPLDEVTPAPESATGDTAGVLLNGGGIATYVRRSDNAYFMGINANFAVLTPTFVAWYLVGTGPSSDVTALRAAPRSNPVEAAATTIATLPGAPDFNEFAANDAGLAWLQPMDDGSNQLYSLPLSGGTPVFYPRPIDSTALAAFEGGSSFLVNDRRAGIPGLYRVNPGSTGGTLTGLLPVRPAITTAMAVSNGRAAYVDDMTEDSPAFLVDVPNGVPDYATETTLSPATHSGVGLSGPYVAYGISGQLAGGRVDGDQPTFSIPPDDIGRVAVSGHRALMTGGVNSRLVDLATGSIVGLGHVYAALFGDYLVTLNYDTAELRRQNLATGGSTVIFGPAAGCTTHCVDEEAWQLAPWGPEVAFAYYYGGSSPGRRSGLWNGNTGASTALPGLGTVAEPAYYEFRYWDGLFLVYANDFTIDLYNLRSGTPTTPIEVESSGDAPMGLDGHVVAWRRLSDLRGVVHDVTNYVPGYAASPRYLGGVVPAGLAPGTATGEWTPSFLVSQDVAWTLTLHSGSASGPVVRTLTGSSEHGDAAPVWDGTNDGAALVPQGTYYWTLTGTGAGALPLRSASGTSTSVNGTVYVSRTALAAPVLTAPTRSTDTSATLTFTVAWSGPSGAPAGTTYRLQRSVNGGAYATVASGLTTTSRAYTAAGAGTYRFRVQAVDAGGRGGAFSTPDTTIVPVDDTAGSFSPSWTTSSAASFYRGSHHRGSAAGAVATFTSTGTQIHLIGVKAPTYGRFEVSIDGGAYSAPIDAYSSSTHYRQVLYTRTGLSNASHTIRVKVLGTSGRPYVGIDGVGFLR